MRSAPSRPTTREKAMGKKDKTKALPEQARQDPSSAKKARNKAYDTELARLQVEIAEPADVGKGERRPHSHPLRGARRRWQGRHDQTPDREGQPSRLPGRRAAGAFGPAEDPALHATLHRAAARRRRGADLRPELVQPPRRRAGDGLLQRRGGDALPPGDPAPGGADHRVGHPAAQVLPHRRREGAGAPLPPAHRRSGSPVEAVADGPRSPTGAGGTIQPPTTR